MADKLTPAQRSRQMGRIRRANTKPELAVRRLLHRMGYRFRVQLAGIPGRPDIGFPTRKKAILVHGCFWHAHSCQGDRLPSTRTEFWRLKFERNKERDARKLKEAGVLGWTCLVVWECEIGEERLGDRLKEFLGPTRFSPGQD